MKATEGHDDNRGLLPAIGSTFCVTCRDKLFSKSKKAYFVPVKPTWGHPRSRLAQLASSLADSQKVDSVDAPAWLSQACAPRSTQAPPSTTQRISAGAMSDWPGRPLLQLLRAMWVQNSNSSRVSRGFRFRAEVVRSNNTSPGNFPTEWKDVVRGSR
jgi:hypothetical protein